MNTKKLSERKMEEQQVKASFKKISNVFSWLLLVAMCILMVYSCFNTYQARKSGEAAFLFGYRPVIVLTGSMEPYMLVNSIALTKEVTSLDEIAVGDVITYHMESQTGRPLRITHRIIAIDNEKIYTKGDNNYVDDGFYLTMDNVEAKVITVFNQTAWIAAKWQTPAGKVMLISIPVCLILLSSTIKLLRSSRKEELEKKRAADALCDTSNAEHVNMSQAE